MRLAPEPNSKSLLAAYALIPLLLMLLFGALACSRSKEVPEASRARSAGAAPTVPIARESVPRIRIEVPDARLALLRQGDMAILSHALPHHHADPCDFSGAKPPLDSITDFHAELEALSGPLPDAVRKREAGTPIADLFPGGDSVRTDPGYLEAIQVGGRTGYRILLGAEGCGEIVSYLPDGAWTLRMSRKKVAEFDPAASPDAKALAGLPGAITPREAEAFADRILASARIADFTEQAQP